MKPLDHNKKTWCRFCYRYIDSVVLSNGVRLCSPECKTMWENKHAYGPWLPCKWCTGNHSPRMCIPTNDGKGYDFVSVELVKEALEKSDICLLSLIENNKNAN